METKTSRVTCVTLGFIRHVNPWTTTCKTTLPYLCSSCCLDSDGNFDFNSALKRLSSHGCTLEAAKLERIFSRSLAHKYKFTKIAGSFIKDLVASELIGPRSGFEAVKTKGDGNCLFNSLSLAIQNNEVLATELRYRTCLEMFRDDSEPGLLYRCPWWKWPAFC